MNEDNKGSFEVKIADYKICVANQKGLIFDNKGVGTSFIERDRILKQKVGSVFHPSISINNLSFRGEYEDPNDLFKAICSVMKTRPAKCSAVNFLSHAFQDSPVANNSRTITDDIKKMTYQNLVNDQNNLG